LSAYISEWLYTLLYGYIRYGYLRSVSGSGNWHPIPTDHVPAVAMIGWHVARHGL